MQPPVQQPKPPVAKQPIKPTQQQQYQADKDQKAFDELSKKADSIGKGIGATQKELEQNKKDIDELKKLLKKARNDPEAAKKIKEWEDAKAKLEKKQVNVELQYQNQGKEFVSCVKSLKDKCQDLANNPSVKGPALKTSCGAFFDQNEPKYPELIELTGPVKLPEFRLEPNAGKLSPWPRGSQRRDIGQPSTFLPGWEEGKYKVPPVGPSSPIDPKTGRPIKDR